MVDEGRKDILNRENSKIQVMQHQKTQRFWNLLAAGRQWGVDAGVEGSQRFMGGDETGRVGGASRWTVSPSSYFILIMGSQEGIFKKI